MSEILYSERGGAWFPKGNGTYAATWPFAKLELTKDSIRVFSGKIADVTASLNDLPEIRRKCIFPLIADGIEITVSGQPTPVTFWSFNARRLVKKLNSVGMQVVE